MRTDALEELQLEAFRCFKTWRLWRAREIIARLIKVDSARPYPHYLLGEVERRQRRWTQAFESFDRAVWLGRTDPRTRYRLGEAAFWAGDVKRAVQELEEARSTGRATGDRQTVDSAARFLVFIARNPQ